MIELILKIDNWQNKSASEIADLLNAKTIIYVDNQLYTWAGIALIIGPQNAESLKIALESNNLTWVVHQLGGSGIQISNDLVQGVLLNFANNGVVGCDILASTCKRLISLAEQANIPTVTVQDVESVLSIMQLNQIKQQKLQVASQRYNLYVDAMDAWDGSGEEPTL